MKFPNLPDDNIFGVLGVVETWANAVQSPV